MKKIFTLLMIAFVAAGCNRINDQSNNTPQEQIQNDQNNNQSNNNQGQDQSSTKVNQVKIALIALEDNGKSGTKIGCDDSVVYLNRNVEATTQPLNAAYRELFAIDSTNVKEGNKEYYNVLSKMQDPDLSNPISFDRATIDGDTAKVYLKGGIQGFGGVCDAPRFQAQIERTALQFSTVKSVQTYLNEKQINWSDFGSQK